MKKVVIIGGGIAGLSAGIFAQNYRNFDRHKSSCLEISPKDKVHSHNERCWFNHAEIWKDQCKTIGHEVQSPSVILQEIY